jgi:hypothetical protein
MTRVNSPRIARSWNVSSSVAVVPRVTSSKRLVSSRATTFKTRLALIPNETCMERDHAMEIGINICELELGVTLQLPVVMRTPAYRWGCRTIPLAVLAGVPRGVWLDPCGLLHLHGVVWKYS